MLILLPIIILLITAGGMVVLSQFQPRFAYHWLIAAGGTFAAWVMTWMLRINLPHQLVLMNWQPADLFADSPALLIDTYSWPFMLALTTLALSVILTDVKRSTPENWKGWAGSLVMVAVGLMAVIAGNPLTLILVWSVIDVLELSILLMRRPEIEVRRGVIIYTAFSIFGTLMVLMADLFARGAGQIFSFSSVPSGIGVLLLVGVGFRLGVLPLHVPFVREPNLRRGFGTIARLVPVAAGMSLLPRIATSSLDFRYSGMMSLFLLISAAYGAVAWARVPNELTGRPYWVLGISSLAFIATLNGLPNAALVLSLMLLFSGGVLFLLFESDRRLVWIPILGALGMAGLPFSPSYAGSALFGRDFDLLNWLFLPIWGILLAGFVGHIVRRRESFEVGPARWVALIYPLGLILLPLTHWILGLFILPEEAGGVFWPGLVILVFAGIGAFLVSRGYNLSQAVFAQLDAVFSFRWVYRVLGRIFSMLENLVSRLTNVLDGEGGVLWSILLAILLISLLVQLGGGDL